MARPRRPGMDSVSPDSTRGLFHVDQIDHVELFVPDRRQAASWYLRVLGLEVLPQYEHWADDPHGPLMISSDGGNTKLALFEGPPQGTKPTSGFHLVAFRVSAEAFMMFLGRLGELQLPDRREGLLTPDSVADHGTAYSLYFSDPYGHRLELTTYEYEETRAALKTLRLP
jgi:catechol 2,3-dioxygenase-like lactoylglutathione lyase family enzyme